MRFAYGPMALGCGDAVIGGQRQLQAGAEAVAFHASRAGEKLRAQRSVCATVLVWIQTDQFVEERPGGTFAPAYTGCASRPLKTASAYAPDLIRAAHAALEEIYRPGLEYKKAGVMLSGIEPAGEGRRMSFFDPPPDFPVALAGRLPDCAIRFLRSYATPSVCDAG